MLDKTTHPYIVNTLESNNRWSLVVTKKGTGCEWVATLEYNDGWDFTFNWGNSISEALDRLEGVLSGRGAELAGRASE